MRRWLILTLLLVAGSTAVGVAAYKRFHWKKFAVVADGVYRSGQLTEAQLGDAIRRLNLKHVVCLNPDAAERERRVCESTNTGFHSYTMPSDGRGDPEKFAEVVRLLRDPANHPILVHCHAGVARTGAAVALYRMSEENWSFDKAITELASFEKNGVCLPTLRDHIAAVASRIESSPR